jgi:hypothetical protein
MRNVFAGLIFLGLASCGGSGMDKPEPILLTEAQQAHIQQRLAIYKEVELTADISHLEAPYQKMLPLLMEAAAIMDTLFWMQAYGEPHLLLDRISDPAAKRFTQINYGPWDRLDNNKPFLPGFGEKPAGANLYPQDVSEEAFESWPDTSKSSLYTLVRYSSEHTLMAVPYAEAFDKELGRAAALLHEAAALSPDAGLKTYLEERAKAFTSNRYYESDLAWMDMKSSPLDLVIGPIETYEDKWFGQKAAFEAYVLIRDQEWSKKLEKFTAYLPELQAGLPVSEEYKPALDGSGSEINAYDVVFYAGDCNAGSKTIAINLPNDERIQATKGTRRLQLKNVMRAKYEHILVPIAEALMVPEQVELINFDAFFSTVMFHEVAHGLGIKEVVGKPGLLVREALKEHASALEEGKADILGLYMIRQLHEKGELESSMEAYYATFMAGIFRSVRFGAASAHGKANMMRFNYFMEHGAFAKDPQSGKYRVDFSKMEEAMKGLSERILTIQGNGDYAAATEELNKRGNISTELQSDLDRLAELGIPVDLVFKQGPEVLGLHP